MDMLFRKRNKIRIFVFEEESKVVVDVLEGHLHKSISHDLFSVFVVSGNIMIPQKRGKISCLYSQKSLLPIDFFDFYNRQKNH